MPDSELMTTRVDLRGLMQVLGQNLYSTPHIALRELVQNAHDSCVRLQVEDPINAFQPLIHVRADPSRRTLVIEDNGAGMTRAEIVDYLATVGRGYTGQMRAAGGPDSLIGAFGLGFLSAYFVTDTVEVDTTSYQSPDVGWRFQSTGGERYHLTEIPPRPIGTRVTLHLSQNSRELCDPEVIRRLLLKYCGLLAVPIMVDDTDIINLAAPWRRRELSTLLHRRACLDFASLYEGLQPICTIDMPPGGPTKGILWIQGVLTYGTSDHRNLSVYVRGMLISQDVRELLPEWAGFIGGVVESDVLVPTASREDLQRDRHFHQAAADIRNALVEGLVDISRTQPEAWSQVLARHSEGLLGAAICDARLYDVLSDQLPVPTSEGDLTVPTILKRCQGKMYVSLGEQGGYEEVLFRALRQPVVYGQRYGALQFCTLHADKGHGTVVRLGTERGNQSLFPPWGSEDQEARLVQLLESVTLKVVCSKFQPTTLPAVLVPDRDIALKRRVEKSEEERRIAGGLLRLVKLHTDRIEEAPPARLYVNLECPLILRILEMAPGPRQQHAARLVRSLAELMSSRSDDATAVDVSITLDTLMQALDVLTA